MSSPFSQAYMDKSPIAELNAKQEAMLPIELKNAINAKEGSEAKDASPAENKFGAKANIKKIVPEAVESESNRSGIKPKPPTNVIPYSFFDNMNDGGKSFGEKTGITGYSYAGQGGDNYEGSVKLNESTDNQFVNSGSAKFHVDNDLPRDYSQYNRPEPKLSSSKPAFTSGPKQTPGIIKLTDKQLKGK
jgi:hypothetical protein